MNTIRIIRVQFVDTHPSDDPHWKERRAKIVEMLVAFSSESELGIRELNITDTVDGA